MAELQERIKSLSLSDNFRLDSPTNRILASVGLPISEWSKLGMKDFMKIHNYDMNVLNDTQDTNAIQILSKIMSFDPRGRRSLKIEDSLHDEKIHNVHQVTDEDDIFDEYKERSRRTEESDLNVSALDVIFLALNRCDGLLRHEIISKMSACQLAVPILLPNIGSNQVQYLIWALSGIVKSWKHKQEVYEEFVVSFPMPIIYFLRIGNLHFSKSNIINKMIGPCQGNNEHPYFISREQDSSQSKYSPGMMEIVWVLPGDADSATEEIFNHPMAFCNLRGDASLFPSQTKFATLSGNIMIIFVSNECYITRKAEIRAISKNTSGHVIAVVLSDRENQSEIKKHNVTILTVGGCSARDLGGKLCKTVNQCLRENQKSMKTEPLMSLREICHQTSIKVDENTASCYLGRINADHVLPILNNGNGIHSFKTKVFPLQTNYWREWATLDKKLFRNKDWEQDESVVGWLDSIDQLKFEIRLKMSKEKINSKLIRFISSFEKNSGETTSYLLSYIQLKLGKASLLAVKPLHSELVRLKKRDRENSAALKNIQAVLHKEIHPSIQEKLANNILFLKNIQKGIASSIVETVNRCEKNSLGLENYIREIGQLFEINEELKDRQLLSGHPVVNFETLPTIGSQMLLEGYPLEILDGDCLHVPIIWVESVLQSLQEKVGNCRLYVLSVIGIQSSGKSTLLNSMFGTKFPVSSGRCTRGVFMQLVSIEDELIDKLKSSFLVILDTEGLRAPERSTFKDFRGDNELATFSLCLADMTLINISGHTIAGDMLNILQIAAHAFIRMTEVDLKCECRIVQQHVGDITASTRNEYGTQAILMQLDDAVENAARDEGLLEKYSRFSDVYNVKLDDNLQYIPSLWLGGMAAPNYKYSSTVLKLKQAILADIQKKDYHLSISDFRKRIRDVWTAIKREDFVFNFQNSVVLAQFNHFQAKFTKWRWELRMCVDEWEINAMRICENYPKHFQTNFENYTSNLDIDISKLKNSIQCRLSKHVEETDGDKEDLAKFAEQFKEELSSYSRELCSSVKDKLLKEVQRFIQKRDLKSNLPRIKNEMRNQARQVAKDLKNQQQLPTEGQLEIVFLQNWNSWISKIKRDYEDIPQLSTEVIETKFIKILQRVVQHSRISQQVTHLIMNGKLSQKSGDGIIQQLKKALSSFYSNFWQTPQEYADLGVIIKEIELFIYLKLLSEEKLYDQSVAESIIEITMNKLDSVEREKPISPTLQAKVLIHISKIAIQKMSRKHNAYYQRNSIDNLFRVERDSIQDEFMKIALNTYNELDIIDIFLHHLVDISADAIRAELATQLSCELGLRYTFMTTKQSLIASVLYDIGSKQKFKPLLDYVKQPFKVMSEYALDLIAKKCNEPFSMNRKSFIANLTTAEINKIPNIIADALEFMESQCDWRREFINYIEKRSKLMVGHYIMIELNEIHDMCFFKENLLRIMRNSFRDMLSESLGVSDLNDLEKIKSFLLKLPKPPHKSVMEGMQTCVEQCPFCGSPCDETLGHPGKHSARLHYPTGLNEWRYVKTKKLVDDICTCKVASNHLYYSRKEKQFKPYRQYKDDFPNWTIVGMRDKEPDEFWKWALATFNEDFSLEFAAEQADIPKGWYRITREKAIESLNQMYDTG